ncbi:hypothetical protein GCM10011274_32470 [Paraglaciecola chathamensis]|uniref:Uncharacterized protein n=1 Tax=Paraglaciecola chathamensis TaxID=368405 RepID=A0A8H9IBM4_9ALTE|nr:hypothetical protein GCM10011274_32470 [Paraglaciecola oceanifecundans]
MFILYPIEQNSISRSVCYVYILLTNVIFRWVLKAGFRKNKKLVSCDKMTNSSVTTEVEKGRKKGEKSLPYV